MASDIITQFADSLLAEAGFADAPKERLEDYRNQLLSVISEKLGIEIMKVINQADAAAFIDLMSAETKPEEYYAFLEKRVPDLDNTITNILVKFREDFLADAKEFDGQELEEGV